MQKRPKNYALNIFSRPLSQLTSYLPKVYKNKGTAALHRVRVSIRRLRNCFWVFKDLLPPRQLASWKKSLKKVTACSGQARDIDTKINFLNKFLQSLSSPSHKRGLKKIICHLKEKRESLQPGLNKALKEMEKSRVLPEIKRYLARLSLSKQGKETGLFLLANKKISRRIKDFSLHGPAAFAPEETEELHALRINAKKLRYTLECFTPLYGKKLAAMTEEVHTLQNDLGATHDCDVWIQAVNKLISREKTDKDILMAGKLFLKEISRLRKIHFRKFSSLWKKWHDRDFFHKISSLITKDASLSR